MQNYSGNNWNEGQLNQGRSVAVSVSNAFIQRVFFIMTAGLAIAGLTAYGVSQDEALLTFLFSGFTKWIVLLAPLGVILLMSSMYERLTFTTATLLFGLFSVLEGLTLSVIFLVYTASSISTVFFIAAGMFAGTAIYGATTKQDLSKIRSLLMMALIGIIIASVVNMFLGLSLLSMLISIVGVIVFVGLTAYDMQKITQLAAANDESDQAKRI